MIDKEQGNDKFIFLEYRFSTLLAHADFNKEKALIDWTKFKIEIKTRFEMKPVCDNQSLPIRERLRNFILLAPLIQSIPGSNSNVDRNFSTLTRILSDKRLSLNCNTNGRFSHSIW